MTTQKSVMLMKLSPDLLVTPSTVLLIKWVTT